MTRNDIAKSLKPIEWAYKHKYGTYTATLGVGGKSLEFEISPALGMSGYKYLVISRNGKLVEGGYIPSQKTLDCAIRVAHNFLVNEVCNLFELDEQ